MEAESTPLIQASTLPTKPKYFDGCHAGLQRAKQQGSLDAHSAAEVRLLLGHILHHRWFEILVLFLVLVEVVATFIEAGIDHQFLCVGAVNVDDSHVLCHSKEGPKTKILLGRLELVGKVIALFFALEMFCKIFIGQGHFFENHWHVLDLIVVTVNFFLAFFLNGLLEGREEEFASVFIILRCWRLLKFVKLVNEEADLKEEILKEEVKVDQDELVKIEARKLCEKYGVALPSDAV